MASSEERPTEDVEGHGGGRWGGQDTEAVDEDQVGDDTEGHTARANRLDEEAVDEDQVGDDTEGHGRKWRL